LALRPRRLNPRVNFSENSSSHALLLLLLKQRTELRHLRKQAVVGQIQAKRRDSHNSRIEGFRIRPARTFMLHTVAANPVIGAPSWILTRDEPASIPATTAHRGPLLPTSTGWIVHIEYARD